MRALRTLLMVAAVSLLGACSGFPLFEPRGPEPWVHSDGLRRMSEVDSLFMYFDYVRRLPAGELAKEGEAVKNLYARNRSDFVRVRYAMLLGVPNTSLNDEARALEVLEPVARNEQSSLHGLAVLLNTQLQEQRRLGAQAAALQQKLDALRSLERSLIERDHGLRKRQ